MSIADHEIEEPVDIEDWCTTHECYYRRDYHCAGCANDEADRQYDLRREERETQP